MIFSQSLRDTGYIHPVNTYKEYKMETLINVEALTDKELLKNYAIIINKEEAGKAFNQNIYNALRDEYCRRSETNSIWWHFNLQTAIYENR